MTAKSDIKTAIEGKGVVVPSSATLDTYSTYISNIDTSSGGGGGSTSKYGNLIDNYSGSTFANFNLYALLENVVVPSGVTTLNGQFPNYSQLKTFKFEEGSQCNKINSNNFFSTVKTLISAELPPMIESVPAQTFQGCSSLTAITIPSTVTSLGNWCFQGCTSLESVNFASNNTLTTIGISAFENCSGLTSITIPSSVTSISDSSFVNTRAMACHVTFPNVASIPTKCFTNSGITGITIPNTVTTIANQALNACKLVNLVIPDSVTTINWYCCAQITTLLTLEIGTGCTSIAQDAFNGCNHLTSITIKATTPPTLANSNAFNSTNNCPIYVPSESVEAYKAASGWSNLASRIQSIT
jgi:hypothetical protein